MKILILHHRYDNFTSHGYLLYKLCSYWANQGHDILLARGANQSFPDADIAILHVDLTKVPDEYLDALKKYPIIINGNVQDISKDQYSDLIVTRDDLFEGEVIVKTNANYGGLFDYRVKNIGHNNPIKRSTLIPWSEVEYMTEYPTFKSIAHVPDDVWKNKNLIVEKFLPEETEENLYQLRLWVFLGEQEIHYMSTSHSKVIKGGNTISRKILANEDVPEELRAIRKKLKFDYGKFDYGIHYGKPILYDANKTPGNPPSATGLSKEILAKVQNLSQGLYDFIK